MVKFFKTMQYTQCIFLNVAIPSLCTGQAFAYKCNGPENGVVWSNIFWACCTISALQQSSAKSYPRYICLEVQRFGFIIELHAYISLYWRFCFIVQGFIWCIPHPHCSAWHQLSKSLTYACHARRKCTQIINNTQESLELFFIVGHGISMSALIFCRSGCTPFLDITFPRTG